MIKFLYKNVLKNLLFLMEPEFTHDLFVRIGGILGKFRFSRRFTRKMFRYDNPALKQKVLGIDFENPVGLSAGFDKDARMVDIMPDVGFGFMQVGTVTVYPYPGNPKPRLYRLKKSKALVVNYGLKNDGADVIMKRLQKAKIKNFPISISIGKTNCQLTADAEKGIDDYNACLKKFLDADLGDFYTINISCPNTFGGEPFTTRERLSKLLTSLYSLKINKPLLLKMPTNLKWSEFEELCETAIKFGVDGVVIGNLNKNREDKMIKDKIPSNIKGSISGLPVKHLVDELISKTYKKFGDKLVIVGVGGVFSAEDAYEKIRRGASLVQLITGMIYEGPQLIGDINKGLVKRLKRDGYGNIKEAIGSLEK